MPTFTFQNIILHTLQGGQGWHIVGIKPDNTREIIAAITPGVGERMAQRWADMAALNLAGKPYADID